MHLSTGLGGSAVVQGSLAKPCPGHLSVPKALEQLEKGGHVPTRCPARWKGGWELLEGTHLSRGVEVGPAGQSG